MVYWFIGLLGCPAEGSEDGFNGLLVEGGESTVKKWRSING